MVLPKPGPPIEGLSAGRRTGVCTVAAAASLKLGAEIAALVGERHVPSLLMAEVAVVGDLSLRDVEVVQRPLVVEAAVDEREVSVGVRRVIVRVGSTVPAVTLIAAPENIDARTAGGAVVIDAARIGGSHTDPEGSDVAGVVRGVVTRVGTDFRRQEYPRDHRHRGSAEREEQPGPHRANLSKLTPSKLVSRSD
jgi:hypothetical protein